MSEVTKQDLILAVAEIRADFHKEMVNQVRWYATIIILQFFAVIAAVGFLDRFGAGS